jgi:hypothetical protein
VPTCDIPPERIGSDQTTELTILSARRPTPHFAEAGRA